MKINKKVSYNEPTTIFGNPLSFDMSSKSKMERVIKSYLPDSIIFAVTLIILRKIFEKGLVLDKVVVDFFLYSIIHLVLTYFRNEYKLKKI